MDFSEALPLPWFNLNPKNQMCKKTLNFDFGGVINNGNIIYFYANNNLATDSLYYYILPLVYLHDKNYYTSIMFHFLT